MEVWIIADQDARVERAIEEILARVFEQRFRETCEANGLVCILQFLCLQVVTICVSEMLRSDATILTSSGSTVKLPSSFFRRWSTSCAASSIR